MLDTKKFINKKQFEDVILSNLGIIPVIHHVYDKFGDWLEIRSFDCPYLTLEILESIDNAVENHCVIDTYVSLDNQYHKLKIFGVKDSGFDLNVYMNC